MAREMLYENRELVHYEWHQSLEHSANRAKAQRLKMVQEAAKKLNLPADAFADNIEHDDDVGVFYPQATETGRNWSSLGEHGKTHKDF